MTSHYLINTLVNWRESLKRQQSNGTVTLEDIRRILSLDWGEELVVSPYDKNSLGYRGYEWRHPKLRELLGEW
ncbi:hypothetical protein [Bacillus sp. C1]